MMTELVEIKENVDVFQSILVVDAMTGQDAVNVAKEFNEKSASMELSSRRWMVTPEVVQHFLFVL